jgi:enamine deaminase RidA (YjgF/YER057c/UK114 family)
MNRLIEVRLKELGLVLPPVPKPVGLYKPVVVADRLLFVSGQVPMREDGSLIIGKVGDTLSLEEGRQAARQVGLTMLATLNAYLGSLNPIHRLIKTFGMVNCIPEFSEHPAVINGFSELMAQVFGDENGVGARSAAGMFLPRNIAVEIEAIFELS